MASQAVPLRVQLEPETNALLLQKMKCHFVAETQDPAKLESHTPRIMQSFKLLS